jgi:hypothetical protein
MAVGLHPPEVLTLTTNDKAHEAGVDFHSLRTLIITSEGRTVAYASISASGREGLTATTRTGRARAISAVLAILLAAFLPALISVRVVVVPESFATRRRPRSGPSVRPPIIAAIVSAVGAGVLLFSLARLLLFVGCNAWGHTI